MGNEAIARWVKHSPNDNPYLLANILTRDLPSRGMARNDGPQKSYADAAPIKSFGSGEAMFTSRCSACHNIGGGNGKALGPDLAGVTDRRTHAWLVNFIKQPDKMRAQKDPAARALMAKYPKMRMPNLGLSTANAEDVLTFIADESRQRKAEAKATADSHEGHHHHSSR